MRQRDQAICIRATDYSETSQVLHFFTQGAGVVRVLGKGTKRPKSSSGGAIDLLCEGDLVFIPSSGEGLGTLVEFTEHSSHVGLRKDMKHLNTALYAIELVGAMLEEGDPHPEVYDLLRKTLRRLSEADSPVAAVLGYFQWQLLRYVGLLGELRRCVSCGVKIAEVSRRDVYFSSSLGGLLCGGCESTTTEKFRLDGAALGGLAALQAATAGVRVNLPDKQAHQVNHLLSYHIKYQLGKELKMMRYVG